MPFNGGFLGQTGSVYVRDVPKPLHAHFSAACRKRGRTMRDVVLEFMRQFAKNADQLGAMERSVKRVKRKMPEMKMPGPIRIYTPRKDKGRKNK